VSSCSRDLAAAACDMRSHSSGSSMRRCMHLTTAAMSPERTRKPSTPESICYSRPPER
jgi:hypothetical protein